MRIGLWDPLFTTGRERAPIIITARLTFLSFSLRKKTGKMQAAMSMNTIALGGIARPTARVAAKKSVFGMPVPGKSTSGFSVRRTVAPATVAMAVESKADPIMEPPFKGITDDIKARAPLILDDFKQGISPVPGARPSTLDFPGLANFPRDQRTTRLARGLETYRNTPLRARIRYPFFREARYDPRDPARPAVDGTSPTWSLPRGKTWFKFCPLLCQAGTAVVLLPRRRIN